MIAIIYLDNASTTKMSDEVFDSMLPYLKDEYGNPGSMYSLGKAAKNAIEEARSKVAHFIGARPEQIIFTSGGTESNNTAIMSIRNNSKLRHIVSDSTEHDSVLRPISELEEMGFYPTILTPGEDGSISFEDVEREVYEATGLVSIMYVNNETGAINPVSEIGGLCRKLNIPFHTDCVQAASVEKLDVSSMKCDLLSLSSHKIYGPKGVGALFVRDTKFFNPLIVGGAAQEFGKRGGTENVASIVGFGTACELMERDLHEQDIYTSVLKQVFYTRVSDGLSAHGLGDIIHLNGNCLLQHGKILNVRFDQVDGETLLMLLDKKGVCVSAGSACRSHEQEPSRVLLSMGIAPEDARNSVRISFSKNNTESEVIKAAEIFVSCVSALHGWETR